MKVVRQPKRKMILRFHLGEGELENGDKFTFGYSAKGLVWYFSKEARYYTIDYKELTNDVLAFREKELMKESKT